MGGPHQNGSILVEPPPNGKHAADLPPFSSPTKPPLRRKNSKALHTGSSIASSPPDSPGRPEAEGQEAAAQEQPIQEVPTRSSPFFAIGNLLRTKSDNLSRTTSTSFDLQAVPPNGLTSLTTAESLPPPQADVRAPRPPARHQRSKSTSLVLGQLAIEDCAPTPPPSTFKRFISVAACVASPRVDHGPKLPPPPPPPPVRPNAALSNPGNMCYFVAMLQCLSYTPGLPELLWRGFPEVPEPPPPVEHEPLSVFAPPALARAASVAAAAAASQNGKAAAKPEAEKAEPSPRTSLDSSSASGSASGQGERTAPNSALLTGASDKSGAGSETAESSARSRENGSEREDVSASVSEAGSLVLGLAAAAAAGAVAGTSPRPQEGAAANGVASSLASRRQSTDGSAERDQKVWEMSRRAAAAAAASEEPEPSRVRQLSQALAFVMAQMRKDPAAPFNPFPAMWAAARLPKLAELIDGNQQDIHEFWMSLTELLSEEKHGFEEAGGSLSDLFLGKLRTLTECKKCHEAKARPAESFFDLSLPPVAKNNGSLTVASSLSAYFTEGVNPDVDCAKCKGAEAAQKQAPPPKTYLGKIQGVFAKSQEGKLWEKPRIQTAPRMLVLHFKRHDVVPPSHSQDQHRVRKVDAAVKVDLALQLDKYMVSSAELPEETDGEAVSNGGDATAPQPEPSCSYRLYGCIFHKGQTQNRGHYYAMCRVGPGDDHWYIFDDHNKPGSISGRPGHEITKYLNLHEIERREVCMLFYEQVPSPQKARK